MDWKLLIGELMAAGVTQEQLAERCGAAQSTISDLHRGATRTPSYTLGAAIVACHAALPPKVQTQPTAAAEGQAADPSHATA